MAEKFVTITKTTNGKTKAATVVESAFEKVWKKKGWKLAQKSATPSTSSTTTTADTPDTKRE